MTAAAPFADLQPLLSLAILPLARLVSALLKPRPAPPPPAPVTIINVVGSPGATININTPGRPV